MLGYLPYRHLPSPSMLPRIPSNPLSYPFTLQVFFPLTQNLCNLLNDITLILDVSKRQKKSDMKIKLVKDRKRTIPNAEKLLRFTIMAFVNPGITPLLIPSNI